MSMYMYIWTYACIYIKANMHAYIYVWMYICIHVAMYIRINVFMCIYVYTIFTDVCTLTCMPVVYPDAHADVHIIM